MRIILHLLTFILPNIVHRVNGQAARSESGCALLNQKIYCFGGIYGPNAYNGTGIRDPLVYSLDPSVGGTVGELANNWKLEAITSDLNLEPRSEFQYAAISDTQMLISGGSGGTTDTRLSVQTVVLDAVNKSLSSYASYQESPYGNRQIYCASSTNVPGKGVAFFGGIESHAYPNWMVNGRTISGLNLTDVNNQSQDRFVGYAQVTYFDVINNVWNIPNQVSPSTIQFSQQQSSFFHSGIIYYLGGIYNLNGTVGNYTTYNSMSAASTFDTSTNIWGTQNMSGGTVPSVRTLFSATLLPKDSNHVLIYGGESVQTVDDYCYILDLTSFTWTLQVLGTSDILFRRTRHSAVLLNNDTLFLVMGMDVTLQVTSTPIILDISNISNIKYLAEYTYTPVTGISYGNGSSQSSLSPGAIAGISVGCATTAIISVVILFLWLRSRQQQKRSKASESDSFEDKIEPKADSHVENVDWDEIDRRFQQRPNTNINDSFEDNATNKLSNSNGANFSKKLNTIVIEKPHFIEPVTTTIVIPDSDSTN